jgi:hypothetical protein
VSHYCLITHLVPLHVVLGMGILQGVALMAELSSAHWQRMIHSKV